MRNTEQTHTLKYKKSVSFGGKSANIRKRKKETDEEERKEEEREHEVGKKRKSSRVHIHIHGKRRKGLKLVPASKGHTPKGAHGRAAVHALGRTKTTGNFARIQAAHGKGAAINAYQNALRAHQGKKRKSLLHKMSACKRGSGKAYKMFKRYMAKRGK